MNDKDDLKKQQKPPRAGMFGRPGGAMMSGGAKAKDFKGSMGKLLGYLKSFRTLFIFVFVVAIASTIFTILSPRILGNVTNTVVDQYLEMITYDGITQNLPENLPLSPNATVGDIFDQLPQEFKDRIPEDQLENIKKIKLDERPVFDFEPIGQIILMLIGLYLLSALFSYVQGWIMARVSQTVTYDLRTEVSEKMSRLPLKYFDTHSHGDTLSRITNDIDTIGQTLNQSLTQLITSFTTIIGIAIMMVTISWQLTLVAIMVVPLSIGFISFIVKRSQKLFKQQQDTLGSINGHIEEMYAGHSIVKVFNGEADSLKRFDEINSELYDSGWKSQFLSGLLMPIMSFIGNIGYVAVAVIGGWLAVQGKLKIGDIQAFIQYLQQFTQPLIQAANVTTVLQSTAASAERVFEFLEAEEEIQDETDAIELKKPQGNVEFKNVVFGYDPKETVIKGFTAKAGQGQRIAIVGPTGAGKTTMVNLLMRFYDVDKGSIEIDGIDIRKMKRSELRKMFGMVLQDTWLFRGTIRENITYGKPDASMEQVHAAAEAAHVDHFISSLPGGYDMELNEAADNISQGEKQLLTIARAMIINPAILILDEATSSVDTRTEVLIQKAMDNLMQGRTSFVIAHRLSTIKNADLILVMNKGNIVEQGTHQQLLDKNGFYADLYNSQFAED